MRKLLSVLLATLMVLAVFPMAIPQTVTAATGDRIAYLDPAGNDLTAALGDNSKPFATFNAAYDALCPEGGTIMFIAPYNVEQDAIKDLGIHYGEIVITADGDYDNYWFIARYVADVERYSQWTVKFGGPVTIENIALVEAGKTAAAVAGDVAEPSEYIFANYNPITIGEGVKCCSSSPIENADTSIAPQVDASSITELTTPASTNVSVNGGALNINHGSDVVGTSSTAPNRLNQMKRDTCVTVNSGVWRAVVGGARHDATSVTTAYNGNYRVYINGGTIGEVIGTNWYNGSNHCGGQSYIYMTGGTVNNVHTGHQSIDNAPQRTSIFVWTGGKIKTDIVVRNSADTFVLYGGDVGLATASDKGVTKAYTGAPNITIDNAAGNADQRMLACDGQSCAVRPRNGSRVTVLPLASTEGQVVYVDQSNGNLNGLGTEDNAVNSYMVALAMFNLVGGKIVLKGDYTISNEDTTSLFAFREPDHCEVVVDGNNNSISNVASSHNKVTVNSVEYTISAGLDNYILSGDTTFQNVKFDFVNTMNFSADFNKLVMGEGISRGEQAVYVLGANYYPTGREGNGNTYNVVYRPQYANHSDADTYITIKSGNFWVSGFSRVLHGDKPFHYGGTAHINIEGGTISHLYPTPTNTTVATAAAAEINISGGVVNNVYTGGHEKGSGTLASLTYNISDDAVIGAFNVIDNCTGTATYNITNNYLTYKKAADAFAAAK
ncbi:MAG: hypothetical protein E7619_03810 [Ruminococcaceae bacterium]|nr:hypothetical protein [Oscillospiraceae bacterium]